MDLRCSSETDLAGVEVCEGVLDASEEVAELVGPYMNGSEEVVVLLGLYIDGSEAVGVELGPDVDGSVVVSVLFVRTIVSILR